MHLSLRVIAARGALGGLMIAAGLLGAPAFASDGHGHSHSNNQGHSTEATINGHAKLDHMPTGSAKLVYDATAKSLTATYSLIGLTPGANYTAGVDQGTCEKGGTALYQPLSFTAKSDGTYNGSAVATPATGTTAATRIPEHGWYIAVWDQNKATVACGNVHDVHHKGDNGNQGNHGHLGRLNRFAHKSEKSNHGQSGSDQATVKLGPTKDTNQHAHGEAHLQLKNGTLTLKINARGLDAKGTYTPEIGQGSCSALGSASTAFGTLSALTQDAHGDWTSTSSKSGVTSFPTGPMYVAIWSGAVNSSDLLACGNVRTEGHN